jgi:hypothetical protein
VVRAVQQGAPHGTRRHSPEQMAALTLATAHGFASLARKDALWKKASAKGLRGAHRHAGNPPASGLDLPSAPRPAWPAA